VATQKAVEAYPAAVDTGMPRRTADEKMGAFRAAHKVAEASSASVDTRTPLQEQRRWQHPWLPRRWLERHQPHKTNKLIERIYIFFKEMNSLFPKIFEN
jgi:hypothetical protein